MKSRRFSRRTKANARKTKTIKKIFRGGEVSTIRINNGPLDSGTYVGELTADGKRMGNGTMTYTDGSPYKSYTGSWVNGMRQGYGVMAYSNGTRYEGSWVHNMKHGDGHLLAEGNRLVENCDYYANDSCIFLGDDEDRYDSEDEDEYGSVSFIDNRPTIDIEIKDISLQEDTLKNIYITQKSTSDDPVEGLVNVGEYIKEDKDNVVFYFINKFYTLTRDRLKVMIDLSDKEKKETNNSIVFICKEAGEKLHITKDLLKDELPYFKLKSIGLYGIVPAGQIKSIIDSEQQYFLISDTGLKAPSVVSYPIYAVPGANIVSGSHCQEGQSEVIYKVNTFTPIFKNEPPSAGVGGKRNSVKRRKPKMSKDKSTRRRRNLNSFLSKKRNH